jgi:hypothetical protein
LDANLGVDLAHIHMEQVQFTLDNIDVLINGGSLEDQMKDFDLRKRDIQSAYDAQVAQAIVKSEPEKQAAPIEESVGADWGDLEDDSDSDDE